MSERAGTTASEATLQPGAAKPSDLFGKPSNGALTSMLLAKGSSLRRSLDEAKAALPEQLNGVLLGNEVLVYFFGTKQTADDYDRLNQLSKAIVDKVIQRSSAWQHVLTKS